MSKKITVLEMGPLPEDLKPKYGAYAPMFERILQSGNFEFDAVRVWDGEPLPSPDDADGFVISGSKHGVYEELPWMLETEDFIRSAAQKRVPIVGICFGHQLMAKALGGKVIKSPKGWGLGVSEYEVKPTHQNTDLPKTMKFNAVHQDQVVEKPESAEVIASSDFCEYAALSYGGEKPFAISLQPHPEFDKDFTKDLIAARRGSSFPEDKSDAAIKSQDQEINSDQWGKFLSQFLTQSK